MDRSGEEGLKHCAENGKSPFVLVKIVREAEKQIWRKSYSNLLHSCGVTHLANVARPFPPPPRKLFAYADPTSFYSLSSPLESTGPLVSPIKARAWSHQIGICMPERPRMAWPVLIGIITRLPTIHLISAAAFLSPPFLGRSSLPYSLRWESLHAIQFP